MTYAKQKTDRMLFGIEIPASWFQSLNSFFIITLAVYVGGFWMRWKLKGKEASSLYKIAIGILIMGFGFILIVAGFILGLVRLLGLKDGQIPADYDEQLDQLYLSYIVMFVGMVITSFLGFGGMFRRAMTSFVSSEE